jgi:predicted ATP-grasp superfamily ATP-dependent carboligase
MVKPHRSLVPAGDGIRHEPAEIVEDEQGLGATTELFGFPVIVQRLEPDAPVHSLAGVAVEGGRLVGVAFAGYARTWPPLAGNASAAGTLDPPPELLEAVEATLRELGWQGIFELELLRLADGRFAAIDFNPRVYGSLALAVRAGANLPAIWCDVLLGRGPSEPVVAAPGYRYRLEDAELRNFVRMLRQAHPGAALALALPRRRVAHAYFRWDDPGPFVLHAVELALNGRASKLRVG